jgi:chitinase
VDCNAGPDSDKEGFAALVQELSTAFKAKGLLLSSAVSPSKIVIDVGKNKLYSLCANNIPRVHK